MKTYLVLDVNYLCWRAFHTVGQLSYDGVATGVVYGLLRDISSLQDRFQAKRLIFCFDRGRSLRALEYPQYKEHRQDDKIDKEQRMAREDMHKQLHVLRREYLKELGYNNVFHCAGYEADDIIASVVNDIASRQHEAVIIGSDKDLYQLLSDRVLIYNPITKSVMTRKKFIEMYGINPVQWVDIKSMAGCKSDNIKGIPGIGEKTALKFLCGKLKAESSAFQKIVKGNDIWQRNRNLTTLPFPGTPSFKIKKDDATEDKWNALTKRLGMISLVDNTRKRVANKMKTKRRGFFQ